MTSTSPPPVPPGETDGAVPDARVVLANRGLAGIDGTLSTASGVALARAADGRPTPVRALVGDLTFLHDASGLLTGPSERRPHLQIVLLDDDGGGIFGLLEPGARAELSSADAEVFERVFATPTGADVSALCAAFGVGYRAVDDVPGLRAALDTPDDGVSVVHVRVDRAGRRSLAQRIAAAVAAEVDAAAPTAERSGERRDDPDGRAIRGTARRPGG